MLNHHPDDIDEAEATDAVQSNELADRRIGWAGYTISRPARKNHRSRRFFTGKLPHLQ